MKWEHARVNGVWKLSKVLNYYLNWICIVLERIFLSNCIYTSTCESILGQLATKIILISVKMLFKSCI